MGLYYDALRRTKRVHLLSPGEARPDHTKARQNNSKAHDEPFFGTKPTNRPDIVFPEFLVKEFSKIQEQIEYSSLNRADALNQCVAIVAAESNATSALVVYYLSLFYALGTNEHADAESERRILVIDTNPHNPSLHDLFRVPQDNGLTEIIEDNQNPVSMLKFPFNAPLGVITAGRKARSTTGLFSSARFSDLLWSAQRQFSHIFLDFAPLSEHADSLMVSPNTRGVLLVVRTGKTSIEDVYYAKELLENSNAPILGVVMDGK